MISMKQDRSSPTSDDWSVVDSEAQNEDTVAAEDSAESEVEELLDSDLEIEMESEADYPKKAPNPSRRASKQETVSGRYLWTTMKLFMIVVPLMMVSLYFLQSTPVHRHFCDSGLRVLNKLCGISASKVEIELAETRFREQKTDRLIAAVYSQYNEASVMYEQARKDCIENVDSRIIVTKDKLMAIAIDLTKAVEDWSSHSTFCYEPLEEWKEIEEVVSSVKRDMAELMTRYGYGVHADHLRKDVTDAQEKASPEVVNITFIS